MYWTLPHTKPLPNGLKYLDFCNCIISLRNCSCISFITSKALLYIFSNRFVCNLIIQSNDIKHHMPISWLNKRLRNIRYTHSCHLMQNIVVCSLYIRKFYKILYFLVKMSIFFNQSFKIRYIVDIPKPSIANKRITSVSLIVAMNVLCHTNVFYYDVIKWKHFQRHWSFVRGIHRSPVNSLHNCARTKSWVNNRNAGDLRCHRAHYEVIVMSHGTMYLKSDNIFTLI